PRVGILYQRWRPRARCIRGAAVGKGEGVVRPRGGRKNMVSDSLTDAHYVLPHQPIPTIRPMLITCPDCATSYEVAPSTFGQAGRSVRCTRCRHVWFAANGGGTEAHPADAAATARGAEQTRPESWLPAHAADVA